MPSKQQIAELSDEMVRRLALKDAEIAGLQESVTDWHDNCLAEQDARIRAEKEIAVLTEAAAALLGERDMLCDHTEKLFDQRNQLRAEIATLRDSRDVQKALAQRYWDDLQTARAEIAALTEQRDCAMALLREARGYIDPLGGKYSLALIARIDAALDTPSRGRLARC